MIYLDFKENLSPLGVFSLNDIKKYFPSFDTRRLNEWQAKGYIKKLRNRWYIFSDYKAWELDVYFAANRIYSPSYISLESALSYHGIIPEAVYATSSISTNKTNHFNTPLGEMFYYSIKKKYFWGYELADIENRPVKIATPEKALLDLLYIRSDYKTKRDIIDLRIEKDAISAERLMEYLGKFGSKILLRKIKYLINNK